MDHTGMSYDMSIYTRRARTWESTAAPMKCTASILSAPISLYLLERSKLFDYGRLYLDT